MSVNGALSVVSGIPDENPLVPTTSSELLAIEQYYIPAYTEKISDIKIKRLSVDRFTMKDISNLSERIGRLEEFSTLSALESSMINFDVLDAETGLNRFKTGYLIETFDTPLTIGNIYSDQFSATFDNGMLMPAIEKMDCPVSLIVDESSGYQITNGMITLPYTESILISQPFSSRTTNLNPFLMIAWNGVLSVTPSSDSWIEVHNLPNILNDIKETVVVDRWVNFPDGSTILEIARTTFMPITTLPFVI
jgi:hypothetical protein